MQTNVNVFTGGPCSGKTSTLNELALRGYKTLPEGARVHLDRLISQGKDPQECSQKQPFEYRIEHTTREIENNIDPDSVQFLDRSVIDCLAYRKQLPQYPYPEVTNSSVATLRQYAKNKYDTVFRFDLVPFDDDGVRIDDREQAEEIHAYLKDEYEKLGYDVVDVPVMSVQERAEFVLEKIERVPPIH